MIRRKSRMKAIEEFAVAAANALIIIGNVYPVHGFNVPFFTMLLTSGRFEEATQHIKDAILKKG